MIDFVNREKLRGVMAEKGLKQNDIAKELGVSRSTFSQKMTGDNRFREHEIYILGKLFGKRIFNL